LGHEFVSELRRWDIVAGLCQSIDAKTYVEVGCKEGRTTGHVLAQCPDLRAIAIDPWCQQEPSADVSRETYADWDFRKIEREFWVNIGDHKNRCEQWRDTSETAVLYAQTLGRQPGLYDVVFIDALHDYESVKQDIDLWWPRVRPGGYLCGHDYNHKWPGVMRAVAERFDLMDVCLGPDSMWWVQKPHAVSGAA
jgi:predicted O-methyltransferase YrrM